MNYAKKKALRPEGFGRAFFIEFRPRPHGRMLNRLQAPGAGTDGYVHRDQAYTRARSLSKMEETEKKSGSSGI